MRNDEDIAALIEELRTLRLRENALVDRIEEAATRRQQEVPRGENTQRPYRTGDRVYVTNRIRRPVFAARDWTTIRERTATVARVEGDRVYITTENGTETWRAAKNLRRRT